MLFCRYTCNNAPNQCFYTTIQFSAINFFVFIFFLLTATTTSYAQASIDSIRKYRTLCNHCEDWIRKGKLEKAILCYTELTDTYPLILKSYIRLAELYYKKQDKIKTLFYANQAMDKNPNESYSPLTYLANKMSSNNDHELAVLILNRLSVSDVEEKKREKASMQRVRYAMQSYADKSPVPGVHLQNMGDSINSSENEYLPSLSLDGNTIVFTRKVAGNEDFFSAKKDSTGKWGKAKNMGYPPNTGMPDGAAMLSTDGHYLFYTRCDVRSLDGIVGGGCDIVFSFLQDSIWSAPQYFGFTINTTAYEGQPCLSSDNKDLYFVSNREGGYGGMDIWISHFENNVWSAPINAGPSINTNKNETSPFIHADNETLYFASDGHPGLGMTDLFISRKNKNNTWKKPINLGAPINTEKFDGSIVINAKGTKGYCTSDREDSKGGLDLYSFDTYPAIQPVPTICLKGVLSDKYFGSRLYDRPIYFTYLFNNTLIAEHNSNEGDASYAQALQMGKRYKISAMEEGYRPFHKLIDLTSDSIPESLVCNIRLKQPGYKDTLYQTTLRIDTSNTNLDSSSMLQLNTLLQQWKQWIEDSADVVLFMKSYYYSGDTITDTMFTTNILQCKTKQEVLTKELVRRGLSCDNIMNTMNMIIYNDDMDIFRTIEIMVVEFY
jgi:hypothetical protein